MLNSVALNTYSPTRSDHTSIVFDLGNSVQFYDIQNQSFSVLNISAKQLNYSVSIKDDLIDFLSELDAHLLLNKTFVPPNIPKDVLTRVWTLVIEGIPFQIFCKRVISLKSILFQDRTAINPFLTESPFDILTSPSYESNIDALFSSSLMVCLISSEYLSRQGLNKIFKTCSMHSS